MTSIQTIAKAMIAASEANLHDINHFMKVWGYARTIGILEGLPEDTQRTLEIAAIVHDIACPLCRQKYGHASGREQEKEGPALCRAFLAQFPPEPDRFERIAWLVGHHHTYTNVNDLDYQILLEADFLVNADESAMSREAILNFRQNVFKTEAGKALLDTMYNLETGEPAG